MNKKIRTLQKLLQLIESQGYEVYLIGGAVLAYLDGREILDIDLATNAQSKELETILTIENVNSKFGAFKIYYENLIIEATTFRTESNYTKFRYPQKIEFVSTLKEDIKRRDFTINTIALNSKLKVVDYLKGVEDWKEKMLRLVGTKEKLHDDALRIIRALRFAATYQLTIDSLLDEAIRENKDNLMYLKEQAISNEISKVKNIKRFRELIEEYSLGEICIQLEKV